MSKLALAGLIAATMALAGLPSGPALAQAPGAATTEKPAGAPSKAEQRRAERKAKADERKAKREEARKAKAEKKASASKARSAARERQKQCGAEWREARKAGKVEKGMTWPKYFSACNARLKGNQS